MRVFGVALLLLVPLGVRAETLVIGTEAQFPPIVFLDESGALTGRDKEIGDAICARAALECDWVVTEFDALVPGVASGRFDLAIAALSATPDRAEIIDFTTPYRPQVPNVSLFVGLTEVPDLHSATIAVQGGTAQNAYLDAAGYDARPYPDNYAALDAMVTGETELYFGPSLFLRDMAAQGYDMLIVNGEASVPSFGTAIAIAKGRDDLRQHLDAIISEMWEDGTLDILHRKWVLPGSDT